MEYLYTTVKTAGTAILRRHLPDPSWPWNAIPVEPSTLLQLPREVRDMILEQLLLETGRIILYYDKHVGYVYRREIGSYFRDALDHSSFGYAFHVPKFDHEAAAHSPKYHDMLSMSLVCRQIRLEAQEVFFCRNQFIIMTTPRPSERLIELQSRWITKVSLWCRPSLGFYKPVWLSVDVERLQESHEFGIRWCRFRYNGDVNDEVIDGEEVQPKVQEWVNRCHAALLGRLRTSSQKKGGQLDLNVLIDMFGGPPMCKQMSLCIYPEPVGRGRRESLS